MSPDPRAEEAWHARGGHASDDADHDEALERQDREREKQDRERAFVEAVNRARDGEPDRTFISEKAGAPPPFESLPLRILIDERGDPGDEPRGWGRCQACYRYGYRKPTKRGLVCYRCR